MAVFEKFENQEVRKLNADVSSLTNDLTVGDLISYDTTTGVVAPITAGEDGTVDTAAKQALADGKELYIVAQGDMITYNEPTDYKTYIIKDVVSKTAYKDENNKKLIAGYLVKTLSNIEV